MRLSSVSSAGARTFSEFFDRWFPAPQFLLPRASGIDISDASIKWLTLSNLEGNAHRLTGWGNYPLPAGILRSGLVQDVDALAHALSEIKPHLGLVDAAHAALPEEAAYVFSMHVPTLSDHEQILRMIEFEFEGRVPIPPSEAVYDFSIISSHEEQGGEIGVTVFPRDLSEKYAEAFVRSGITLLSLEVEARSIARAVSSSEAHEPITLIADFGRARTGIAVVKRGVPIFTSTVEVGGDALTNAAIQSLSLSPEKVEDYRNTVGLLPESGPTSAAAQAFVGVASALSDEIARHYRYWDTRRNDDGTRATPVGKVLLVGGSSNLNGLPEYVAARVQAPVERGNIWRHICTFDEYIPPIDRAASLQFATAAGLALRTM